MKKYFILLIIFALLPVFVISQQSANPKTALLLIDFQEFYFPSGYNALVEPEAASNRAAVLLDYFRKNKELVVFLKHAVKKDSLIHSSVSPIDGEKVITKHEINSYLGTDLHSFLQANDIKRVVICGMMTHMCVEAAARASADLEFDVLVISDACATKSLTFSNDTVLAKDVHASTLATIENYYGKVMTVKEFLAK
jgi:nicotinamidase-related amidase